MTARQQRPRGIDLPGLSFLVDKHGPHVRALRVRVEDALENGPAAGLGAQGVLVLHAREGDNGAHVLHACAKKKKKEKKRGNNAEEAL